MTYIKVKDRRGPIGFDFRYRGVKISVEPVGEDRWVSKVIQEWNSKHAPFVSVDFKTRGAAIDKALKWVDRMEKPKRPSD